jgi:hypothetical protein
MVTSTSIRYATELLLVPIVVMNKTVFLEVLLICTPKRSISCLRLNASPSMPVAPM